MVMTPPTTTLTALEEDFDFQRSQSWRKPFAELLLLLQFITSSNAVAEIENHRFCFRHTHDLSELSMVFLSVDTPSGFEYKIDFDDIRSDDSDPCPSQVFVSELEEYANRVLSIRSDDSDPCPSQVFVSELEEYANRVLSRVRDYSDQLIKNDIIHDASLFADVNLLTCPLCHSRLQSCGECEATVACSNDHCAGSEVVDFKICDAHERITCHGCLDSKEPDPNSAFVRCPSCNSWCCSREVDWCPGRIIHPTPGTKELAELYPTWDLDSKPTVRSHLPRPGPCGPCIDSGHVDAWQACSGGRSDLCPSNAYLSEVDLDYAYCPECITEHTGRRCTCGAVWFCDACPVADFTPASCPKLISCPRCGATYCRQSDGCQYCHFCDICHQTGLCFGCQAREKGDVGGEDTPGACSQPVNAFEQCADCQLVMCNECCSTAKDGVTQCLGCHHWMCGKCARLFGGEQCHFCL